MVEATERRELERRARLLRGGRPRSVRSTAARPSSSTTEWPRERVRRWPADQCRKLGAARVIVAVPVASPEAIGRLPGDRRRGHLPVRSGGSRRRRRCVRRLPSTLRQRGHGPARPSTDGRFSRNLRLRVQHSEALSIARIEHRTDCLSEDIVTISDRYRRSRRTACRDRLGDPSGWVASDAYRHSLALCIIESVQSSAGHSEVAVVDRYLAYRRAHPDQPLTDGARDLLRTFEEAGSSDQWAGKIGSYKRRYTATGVPIEARHIQLVGRATPPAPHQQHRRPSRGRVPTTPSSRSTTRGSRCAVTSSDVTWAHLLMLAGIPGAGRIGWRTSFISGALGISEATDDGRAEEILAGDRDRTRSRSGPA